MVGAGNVAVDVARMLALTPEELAPTDTADAAIDAICGAGIREIVMVARRGPVQAAFTNPELIELGELAGADVIVDPADLELDPASEAALEGDTNAQRNLEVLREYAAREPAGKPRRVVLRFCVSPVEILGEGRVEAIELVRNRLEDDGSGYVKAVADRRARDARLRDRLPQRRLPRRRPARRALRRAARHDPQRPRPRPRRAGRAGARRLLRRLDQARPQRRDRHEQEGRDRDRRAAARGPARRPAAAQRRRERGRRSTRCSPSAASAPSLYSGWLAIDEAERAAGEPAGRPRVKLCTWDELLGAAGAAAPRS